LYKGLDRSYIPSSYDARRTGTITVPKNQMSCGSCAAFAATSVHETCLIKAGVSSNGMDLSEQQLVDCAYDGKSRNSCKGAWVGAYQVKPRGAYAERRLSQEAISLD
jgi:C1A family cysteine protease